MPQSPVLYPNSGASRVVLPVTQEAINVAVLRASPMLRPASM